MIAGQAAAEKASLGASPRFIAFASLSMPPEALKALVHDMTKAGGVTVLRGFPQGNSEAFKKRLAAIWSNRDARSEEHTSELQSLMRISYAVFCLKKKKNKT